MLRHRLLPLSLFIVSAFLIHLVGCGPSSSPKVPESGSIQQFLDENPDYKEASDLEVASEEEEFDAAGEDGE